jgi:hypothetical protein
MSRKGWTIRQSPRFLNVSVSLPHASDGQIYAYPTIIRLHSGTGGLND